MPNNAINKNYADFLNLITGMDADDFQAWLAAHPKTLNQEPLSPERKAEFEAELISLFERLTNGGQS